MYLNLYVYMHDSQHHYALLVLNPQQIIDVSQAIIWRLVLTRGSSLIEADMDLKSTSDK